MNNKQITGTGKETITIVVSTPFAAVSTAVTLLVGIVSLMMTVLTYRQHKQSETAVGLKPSTLKTTLQNQLHDILDNAFSDLELREVCYELGVDYEDLPFSGQTYKARELVARLSRNGRLDALCQVICQMRPHLKAQIDNLQTHSAPEQSAALQAASNPLPWATKLEKEFSRLIQA